MKITNETTTYQVAELMGSEADEKDGRILLSLLSRDCITDTNECDFLALIEESQKIRRNEEQCEA
jgi:hypothetical protein